MPVGPWPTGPQRGGGLGTDVLTIHSRGVPAVLVYADRRGAGALDDGDGDGAP
eukprot:COSAG02_NODE_23275_length_723_cov_340.469551_2_plen_52_part_01